MNHKDLAASEEFQKQEKKLLATAKLTREMGRPKLENQKLNKHFPPKKNE